MEKYMHLHHSVRQNPQHTCVSLLELSFGARRQLRRHRAFPRGIRWPVCSINAIVPMIKQNNGTKTTFLLAGMVYSDGNAAEYKMIWLSINAFLNVLQPKPWHWQLTSSLALKMLLLNFLLSVANYTCVMMYFVFDCAHYSRFEGQFNCSYP